MEESAIKKYIGKNNFVTVAELQLRFGLDYREAKGVIDKLVENGSLVYKDGLTYARTEKASKEKLSEVKPVEAINMQNADDSEDEEDRRDRREKLRRELFSRRDMLLRRMSARTDNVQVETEEEDDDEPFRGGLSDEATKYKIEALKVCIECGAASVSIIQRNLPVSYIFACKIMDWMQSQGYISMPIGYKPRTVLITKEQFERLYGTVNGSLNGENSGTVNGVNRGNLNGNFNGNGGTTKQSFFKVFNSTHTRDVKKLVDILVRIKKQKSNSVTADKMPKHPSWQSESSFNNTVHECMNDIAKSSKSEGLAVATRIAEARLDGVRDTHDRARMEVYERVVYEFKNFTQDDYYRLRKTVFHD